MTREEQIEKAAQKYIKDIITPLPASMITAYIKGAEYADQHPIHCDWKAMLHVLSKSHKQGWNDAIEKASLFVYHLTAHPDVHDIDGDELVESFIKYMEENK